MVCCRQCIVIMLVTCTCTCTADIKNVNKVLLDKLSRMYTTNSATKSEAIHHLVTDILDSCSTDVTTKPDHVISTEQLIGVCRKNVTQCQRIIDDHCFDVKDLLTSMVDNDDEGDDGIKYLKDSFPAILLRLVHKPCTQWRNESASPVTLHRKVPSWKAWLYGSLFVALICFISNVGAFLAPFQKKPFFQRIMLFCVGLAVGALASTGFLMLIPKSMGLTKEDSPVPDYRLKMTTVLAGLYLFYVAELLLRILFEGRGRKKTKEVDCEDTMKLSTTVGIMNDVTNGVMETPNGHSHYRTKMILDTPDRSPTIPPVAFVILIGDALHNFVDGIAIGAAFTENIYVGISVSLAVICEELPHELGDVALLLHLGLPMKRALMYNFLAACSCFVGLVVGILVGENTDGNMWIFAIAGGMFVYISLVDMIPEMKQHATELISKGIESPVTTLLMQNAGLVTGFVIILILIMYGDDISL